MIHFRLRRSVRLAIHILSLYAHGVVASFRFAASILRDAQSNSAAILVQANPPDLQLHRKLHATDAARRRPPARKISSRSRRYLASSGLLLALSLEVCGCNPVEDAGVSSLVFGDSRIVPPSALIEHHLSFYDPAELSAGSSAMPPPIGGIFADAASARIEAKPSPWAIPESVYLVYKGRTSEELQAHQLPLATAFVLRVADPGHNRFVRFLVTARHVVDPVWAHCSEKDPLSMDIRLNRRSGGFGYETVLLRSGSFRRFFTPSDASADIAIVPLDRRSIANLDEYKFLDVPSSLLPTEAELRLVYLQQPVMTAGLPAPPSAEAGNYPTFDAGFLSNKSAETVDVQCGSPLGAQATAKALHIWFITSGASQGVSGAPVYTAIRRDPGSMNTPVLLGVQSVAWPDKGMAGITPSYVLSELVQTTLRQSKLDMAFAKATNP